jgi:hypothetical protein
MTNTTRITGTDGKQYDVTFELVPAVPESWKIVSIAPVPVIPKTIGGVITAFNPANAADSVIGGSTFHAWNASKPYCLQKIDDSTVRFEMRSGDNCPTIGDPATVDRSQLDGYARMQNNDTIVKTAFRIMIEAGEPNSAPWFVVAEQHNNDQQIPGKHTSPIFAIELSGERFSTVYRYCRPGGDPSNGGADLVMMRPWTQSTDLKRGQWYAFELEARANQNGGYLKVKLDGADVVNYAGPLGYGCQTYWIFGPYRYRQPQIFAAQYRSMTA